MAEDDTDERDLFFSARPAPRPSNTPPSAKAKPEGKAIEPQDQLQGHRERLRERARRTGPETLADYELLELLLFRFVPRADTKSRAKALIERFGSLAEVLGAPPHLLAEVKGIGPAVAFDLKMVAAAASRMARGELRGRQVLTSWSAVIDYCKTAMAFEEREQFRILFLDKKNKLIADEVQQVGTVDQTPAYPREVVRRALELSATAVVLVHNHPSGDPTPSRADIDITRRIAGAAEPLGIAVHDHIIIGRDNHLSMKGAGYF